MSGTYRTIVADPPWRYKGSLPGIRNFERDAHLMAARGITSHRQIPRSQTPYTTLSVEEIATLPVSDLAARDAHLYLWTTNTHLPAAFAVVRAWGFRYSTTLVWAKQPRGRAGSPTFACATEFVPFCRRGSLSATERVERNWWEWPRGEHSQKPEHFIDLVEQVSPGPYLELCSRRHRLGWDVWGNEVESSLVWPGARPAPTTAG